MEGSPQQSIPISLAMITAVGAGPDRVPEKVKDAFKSWVPF